MYRDAVRLYDGVPRTKHVTTNLIVEVDLATAATVRRPRAGRTSRCSRRCRASSALQPIIAGRYHDVFECVDGTWRFRRRQMFGDLYGDLSHHMLFDLPDAAAVAGRQLVVRPVRVAKVSAPIGSPSR